MVRLSQVVALTVLCPMPLAAQADPSVDEDMLNLFLDCQTGDCFDSDFFRREVPVVNWVLIGRWLTFTSWSRLRPPGVVGTCSRWPSSAGATSRATTRS